jgi:hypothetical protein
MALMVAVKDGMGVSVAAAGGEVLDGRASAISGVDDGFGADAIYEVSGDCSGGADGSDACKGAQAARKTANERNRKLKTDFMVKV